jgi:hypothetical protein
MGGTFAGFVGGLAVVALLPSVSHAAQASPTVRVVLLNGGVISDQLAVFAQAEVARLYQLIDVNVVWVQDASRSGEDVRVIKITSWEPREGEYPWALGMTPTSPGKRRALAYVFWTRVQRSAQKHSAGVEMTLAVAIAHELGHLLLPEGAHSKSGLMRESWDANHFRSAAAGLLHFSPESAETIRRGLSVPAASDGRR